MGLLAAPQALSAPRSSEGHAELKASEKRLRALISASSDAVYRMSADWTEMYHLRGQPGQPNFLTETLDSSPDWINQYIHPLDQPAVREAIDTAVRTRSVFELEHRVFRADGSLGWTQSRAVPVFGDDGNISEWFGMASDITNRKLSEEALIESEKLAAVGRLAGSIAHEIYNPLDAVRNILWLVQSDNSTSVEHLNYLKLADEEVTRVIDLVKQTLSPWKEDVSKSVCLGELIDSVMVLFGPRFRNKSTTVLKEVSHDLVTVAVESDVRHLLMILLNNSLEALPPFGGKICLRVTNAQREEQTGVKLVVADNGHGISESDSHRLFQAFFSTQPDVRTGLGLWIGKGIVEGLKGSIRFRSSKALDRAWTVFSVFLPNLAGPHAVHCRDSDESET